MTDASAQSHRHAHEHAAVGQRAAASSRINPARASLLEASAAARLLGVMIAVAALWTGVFWALH
jgi:hypothetical protein